MFVVAAFRTQFRRLRFLQLIAVKGILYTVIILASDWLGDRLFEIGGTSRFGLNRLTVTTLLVALAVSIAFNFVMRSEEHTSELQSLMRISYAVFCLKKKNIHIPTNYN